MAVISGLVVALLVAMTLYIESVHAQLRAVKETIGHVSPVRITCCQPFSTRRYFGLDIYNRPVYRSVKICRGSCTSRSDYVITDGGIDDFAGAEPTRPSELFLNSRLLDGKSLSLYFDKLSSWDLWTAHTIEVPRRVLDYCADILRIQFRFCVKASRSWLATNDNVFIWNPQPESDSLLWSSYIRDLPTPGTGFGPHQYRCHTSTYQPGDPIFQYIITYGDLNVAIQDDTFFDYTQLTLIYDKTPKSCRATKVKETTETLSLSKGVIDVTLVNHLECDCQDHSRCNRFPLKHTFFENSYFEQQIDVGKCAGNCRNYHIFAEETDAQHNLARELDARRDLSSEAVEERFKAAGIPYIPNIGTSCQPLHTHVEFVKGPNGGQCVEVIDKCRCLQRCYRKVHLEEYVELISTGSGYRESRRVYNVGKCAGKCSSRQECVALSYHNYPTILLRDGTKKQVQAIGRCGCK